MFDTSRTSNSNAGHEFRNTPPNTPGVIGPLLTHEQRLDIIEYLKMLDSVQIPDKPMASIQRFSLPLCLSMRVTPDQLLLAHPKNPADSIREIFVQPLPKQLLHLHPILQKRNRAFLNST